MAASMSSHIRTRRGVLAGDHWPTGISVGAASRPVSSCSFTGDAPPQSSPDIRRGRAPQVTWCRPSWCHRRRPSLTFCTKVQWKKRFVEWLCWKYYTGLLRSRILSLLRSRLCRIYRRYNKHLQRFVNVYYIYVLFYAKTCSQTLFVRSYIGLSKQKPFKTNFKFSFLLI